ncbi:hypothetical protein GGU11DRAFT_144561 [Lentinula aff. detonsa]|nr:hypothetical protein GGU11DRAFT_144561 [Lentinula aff. detonsa]
MNFVEFFCLRVVVLVPCFIPLSWGTMTYQVIPTAIFVGRSGACWTTHTKSFPVILPVFTSTISGPAMLSQGNWGSQIKRLSLAFILAPKPLSF